MLRRLFKRHKAGQRHKPYCWPRGARSIAFDVAQSGNTIQIRADDFAVSIVVDGIVLPVNVDSSFSVWLLLPIAMAHGFDLRINRPVDPLVIENAEKLSAIWEMWAPQNYRSVKVRGQGQWSRPSRSRHASVSLYSGGIDSTYALLRQGRAESPGHVLTIQGLGYRADMDPQFTRMLAHTQPLLDHLNLRRLTIKSDLKPHVKPSALSHGFSLAGYLFLLSDLFSEGTIAADYTPAQDMLSFPWGTNHVTNQYFAGSDFKMQTVCADVGRAEKVATVAQNDIALKSSTFCLDKAVRPDNCGVCAKCVRTKAMFVAATGSCPDIFIDPALTEKQIMGLDLAKRNERLAFADLYAFAKKTGRVDQVPGLARRYEMLCYC